MKRDQIKPKAPNSAASLYAALGGTAFNQSMAILLGWEANVKPVGEVRPAGTKILRAMKAGSCTVRHGGPFDLRGNARKA